ncbi:hypothetical protein Q8G28_13600 [Lysinibacillus capsici]|uniref:hypothetical protein n=1 Tax=Lysinibacillus capsici TaxID=2115968 RepID=UPI00272FDCD5|nr:hypothetical protein [Lysinibacillus capsici]MDP1394431.1 hypothetical protein [Lysinibacillus capsici]MDP1414898.1 hypothetical protein [Lysinibacillus capsici]MDP1430793.1 hypothetical protein [Lysinibacillus capsici]
MNTGVIMFWVIILILICILSISKLRSGLFSWLGYLLKLIGSIIVIIILSVLLLSGFIEKAKEDTNLIDHLAYVMKTLLILDTPLTWLGTYNPNVQVMKSIIHPDMKEIFDEYLKEPVWKLDKNYLIINGEAESADLFDVWSKIYGQDEVFKKYKEDTSTMTFMIEREKYKLHSNMKIIFYDKHGKLLATFESEDGLNQLLDVNYEINFEK